MSVSACLIVRDEAARVLGCLTAVRPFVDDVVVLDTGSADGTAELAAAAGARVRRLAWRDDFAAARNEALADCLGDWVLSLDADEVATGVPAWLAPLLAVCGAELDGLSVLVRNAGGPDARGLAAHREVKLLRRGRLRWAGRVHERPVRLDGGEPLVAALPEQTLSLVHHGYLEPAVVLAKAQRNARLSRLELAELQAAGAPVERIARTALDLGRSELASGRPDLALEPLRLGRDAPVGSPVWSWATDFLLRLAIEQGRPQEATALAAELFRAGAPAGYCRWLLAQALIAQGELGEAARLLAGLTELVDLSGNPLDGAQLDRARAACAAPARPAGRR
ncbi:MAG TPA: glycosyltransferase [Jatrophihabitans sp.]|nr:glycosyltransferase [Jatrophihabitans sp.]